MNTQEREIIAKYVFQQQLIMDRMIGASAQSAYPLIAAIGLTDLWLFSAFDDLDAEETPFNPDTGDHRIVDLENRSTFEIEMAVNWLLNVSH